MAMNNSKGKSDIMIAKAANTGKGSIVNIGLMMLEEEEAEKRTKREEVFFTLPIPRRRAIRFLPPGEVEGSVDLRSAPVAAEAMGK